VQPNDILRFLQAVDAELTKHAKAGERLDLHLLGRSALILHYGLGLGTKDVDIVWKAGSPQLEDKALEVFGKGTANAAQWGLYLEAVPQGLPPIPQGYCKRCQEIPGKWQVLRPKQPDLHDLAVTKLKRFHAKDREDLQIMCDKGDLTAERLRSALDLAFAFSLDDEEDPGRKAAYQNVEKVIAYLNGTSRTL
jgi:Nucleotidyltransferase of unknown function (DUF6036)